MRKTIILIMTVFISIGTAIAQDKSVELVTMSPAQMVSSISSGSIDGFIAWEPFCADAAMSGLCGYYFNSSEVWPEHPCCVLTASSKDLNVRKAMIWVHLKSLEFMENPDNRGKVIEYAMEFTGKPREVAEEALKNIHFIDYPRVDGLRKYLDELNDKGFFPQKLTDEQKEGFWKHFLDKSFFDEQKSRFRSQGIEQRADANMRIGYLTADLHQLEYYVAYKEGYFSRVFESCEFIPFKNGPAVMNAYKAGMLDAAYLGAAPAILKSVNEGIDIVLLAGVNNNGSALMANKDVLKSRSLEGAVLATPGFGTVQDLILRMYASENGIEVKLKD